MRFPFHRLSATNKPSSNPIGSLREVESLIKLAALDIGYMPWTSSSMTAQAIVYILNEIKLNRRQRILELGMGLSTFYIAKLMQNTPEIELVSIDHDASWVSACKAQLAAKGLIHDNHIIIHAPLARQITPSGQEAIYYDLRGIRDRGAEFRPDLVVVDGPPAWRRDISKARIPAYDFFSSMISENATVFIDDYLRAGEAELLALFLAEPDWKLVLADPSANVAIARNHRASFNAF